MRFRALLLPVLVGYGLAASPGLSAQSIVGGSLSGTTARSDGGVVPQALVTLTPLDGGFQHQTIADRSGVFTFEFLDPGTYELRADRSSYSRRSCCR